MSKRIDDAARFIAPWEGFRSCPYQDSGGVWTRGYGTTTWIGPGSPCVTHERAERELADDLRGFAHELDRLVKVPLTRREEIACLSFMYNVGVSGFRKSSFLRYLNRGKRRKASNRLLLWVRDAYGNVLLGLLRRRRAERWLMRHPRKSPKHSS